jgi:para-aminobenzoate synthetase/4-amino-4-deoxychorismate lyase
VSESARRKGGLVPRSPLPLFPSSHFGFLPKSGNFRIETAKPDFELNSNRVEPAPNNGTVWLHEPSIGRWLLFQQPGRVFCTSRLADVLPLLKDLDQAVETSGAFAAGFISYEAAPAFDSALQTPAPSSFPLVWFGLYNSVREFDSLPEAHAGRQVPFPEWSLGFAERSYLEAIETIRRYIRAGDTYQVNLTLRLHAELNTQPWLLFQELIKSQGAHYSAFLRVDPWAICSASPELFFRLEGGRLISRPMKGTAARGLWPEDDEFRGKRLLLSAKDRAENTMIVDMVRNDFGRVATPGSVTVDRLFDLEKYPTLWQMTSTVGCDTKAPLPEIFSALFPAASITGAPKVRTMQIITELEQMPRNIYTGAIGFIAPGRRAAFNVAIRTMLADTLSGTAEYGVGGGIVWDSIPRKEWEECRLKMQIVTDPGPSFDLLETILWEPGSGFFLLERHFQRLAASLDYFCRQANLSDLRQRLKDLERTLPASPTRVRVAVNPGGEVSISHSRLKQSRRPFRVALALEPVSSHDRLLYHKTSQRQALERALAGRAGMDDVLLWNQNRELTQSTIANIVLEKNGELLTPPISCGLLGGVYRGWLLEQKKIREKVLTLDDLAPGAKLYLINSVRRMWQVWLSAEEPLLAGKTAGA